MSADQRHFLFAALTLAAAVALGLIVGGSSLGRRCGHSITPTSFETPIPKLPPTAPNFEGLAYRYEPTLVVARSDRNWPTSIHTVLELQIGGRITCLHSNPACDDPESAASGFGGLLQCALSGGACAPPLDPGNIPAGGGEDWLVYPTPLTDSAEQVTELASAVAGSCSSTAAESTFNPQLPFDPRRFSRQYFFPTRDMPPKFQKNNLQLGALRLKPPLKTPLYSLQYWFFYPFNYLPVSVVAQGHLVALAPDLFPREDYHQGDLEHIDVLVDALGRPVGVYMARHSKSEAATLPLDKVLWERDVQTGEPSHPVVFAGLGGHASYSSCMPVRRHLAATLNLYDYPVCPSERGALLADYKPPPGATVAPAYVFRDSPLLSLAAVSWACWNGRLGDVPRIPAIALELYKSQHLDRLPRLAAWSKLKLLSEIYPKQPGPAAPLTQDGHACARTRAGPSAEQTNPQG